jgi:serpin B
MSSLRGASALMAGLLLLQGSSGARAQEANEQNSPAQKVAQGYNTFGFRLLANTATSNAGKNILISPAGAAFVLSMVENGARGETLRQIASALRVKEFDPGSLGAANAALLHDLSEPGAKVELRIANGIWVDKKAAIRPEFISANQKDYNAEIAPADFSDPAMVGEINSWASRKTEGKIPRFLEPPLDPRLRMILLDAIYFKGKWSTPFDKKFTQDKPFKLADEQSVQVPRMSRSGNFMYYENQTLQIVRLPYGDGDMAMYACLPKSSLETFIAGLNADTWQRAAKKMVDRKGRVELPRFKFQASFDLTGNLKALGITSAFGRKADLSGISEEPLKIDWVKQKTFVDVNEEGTEAAAVTGAGIVAMAIRREPPPFEFIADRPFFIAIQDRNTGLFLFLGAILDPRST